MSKMMSKGLSLILAMLMVLPTLNVAAADEYEIQKENINVMDNSSIGENYYPEDTSREQINFNCGWKFYLGDVENGQITEYDDSSWTDIAIPHNFSVPYDMESNFYVGYGWYRKEFQISDSLEGKQVGLEFEGVFQVAEVYVNGQAVGTHEGGYTGFEYDITDYLVPGKNQIAVRVNNIWQPDLTPRAGDHQFTGGIYRDVYLNITDDVHVTWYGTFVTTPDLTNPGFDESAVNVSDSYASEKEIMENIEKKQSNVNVQTEVKNDSDSVKIVWVKQQVADAEDVIVAEFYSDEKEIQPGDIYNFNSTSEKIQGIHLWDTETPYLYTVYTTVYSGNEPVDTFESPLGFRWAQYRDDGFYLNGKYTLLNGANVHQDHGGWADAVTNSGFCRDVQMIKEAGMNFIRGSHYPHDPSFAAVCDETGILFWSESVFWGMGGCAGKDDPAQMSASDWFKDAYPQNPDDEEAFEESCLQTLTDMIRINRNHPSIINWSMGNEVFFTADATQQKAKNLVNKMRNLSHLLDPTRKAGMGGVQRQGYDSLEICDIAGYNGDGGKITNTWMPNVVAEYGSKTADRPGELRPYYDQIAVSGTQDQYQLTQNSAGLSLWCAFHHGTIGGSGLAKMGMIDYYRLPLNTWYWYREHYTGVPAEQSKRGTASQMELTASAATMTNDGTEDIQIILTMKDDADDWVNTVTKVTLEVVSGPGVFPTGKEYTFLPNKTMIDGKAAIEFRSYYPGETIIRASANGMQPAELKVTTLNVTGTTEEEPENFYVMPETADTTEKIADPVLYGTSNAASGRPAFPSSNDADRTLAADGDISTSWTAEKEGSGEYWMSDLEFTQYLYKIKLGFEKDPYPYKIEVAMDKDSDDWITVAEYTKETVKGRPYEESLNGIEARHVKITFTDVPDGEYAFLSECEVYGTTSSQSPQYASEWKYLSDLEAVSESTGWGSIGKDVSCEGNPISVGGISYEKGLGFHADSEIIYDLEGKYTRFQAYAGIDDEVVTNVGDAIFQVYADGKVIYEKNLLTGDSDRVDLSVSGVNELKLVTTTNGAASNDHTDWADAKVLGAIRDITVKGSGYKTTFTSNTKEFHAGETWKAVIGLENTESTQTGYIAALTLYDADGTLLDLEFVDDYLAKGKKTIIPINMEIPEYRENGRLHVNVWKTETLEPIAHTVIISADSGESDYVPDESLIWTRADGEDMIKVGNWKVWTDSKAYETTETYTGDNDTPLTEDTSISYTFTGISFRIGAKVDQGQRGADIYIDGVKAGTINNQATENINEYRQVFDSGMMEYAEHTVKLVPIGKLGIDYIEFAVLDEAGSTVSYDPDKTEMPGEALSSFFKVIETEDMSQYTGESRKDVSEAMKVTAYMYEAGKAGSQEYKAASEVLKTALGNLEKSEPQDPDIPITDPDNPVELPYEDVKESDWFYESVCVVFKEQLMTGLNEKTFGPSDNLARAQFAVILYRMEGEPEISGDIRAESVFADVQPDTWYTDAVTWAYQSKIITGYTDSGLFGTADNITREQMSAMMFRYAKFKNRDTDDRKSLSFFPDGGKVQSFAREALEWCAAEQIITGKGVERALDPQGNTNRAECAAIISRYISE